MNLVYNYDNVGNVASIVDANAGGTQTQSFTYDYADRLTSAVASGGTQGAYTTKSYAYNAIGNITSTTDNGAYTYAYNPTGSGCTVPGPLTYKPHAVTATAGRTWVYDCNGAATQRTSGVVNYDLTYDQEGRMRAWLQFQPEA